MRSITSNAEILEQEKIRQATENEMEESADAVNSREPIVKHEKLDSAPMVDNPAGQTRDH